MELREVGRAKDVLVLEGEFESVTPDYLFQFWIKPELVKGWKKDPRMDWNLRGDYIDYDPGKKLSFTWRWAESDSSSDRDVMVDLVQLNSGNTKVRITHGPYREEENHQRKSDLRGWEHFCRSLRRAVSRRD